MTYDVKRIFIRKQCDILINDALFFLKASENAINSDNYPDMERYARSSVLNITLLLEAGANSCLDSLDLPSKYANDIDRLPILSKYEFFLNSIKPDKVFDRGRTEIQYAEEIISIRRLLVHPKVQSAKLKKIDEKNSEYNFGEFECSKLSKSIEEWHFNETVTVIRITCTFLDYFFRILCELNPNEVKNILFGSLNYRTIPDWEKTQNNWSLRLRFLGLTCKKEKSI